MFDRRMTELSDWGKDEQLATLKLVHARQPQIGGRSGEGCMWQSQTFRGVGKLTRAGAEDAFAERQWAPATNAAIQCRRAIIAGSRYPQQPGGIAVQYRLPVGIAQPGRSQNMLDRGARPRVRIVGPQHDLARSAFRHQVPQRLRREH